MSKFERAFVWLGGALFVSSLAACVYTYAIRWASPRGSGGSGSFALDLALFAAFGLHHSLFARESIKNYVERIVPEAMIRSVYVWTASLLLFGELYRATGMMALAMTATQLAGVCLIARAVATINPLELAGIRPAAPSYTLQVRGPYRFVRHPLYLGWMLAAFGAAHMTGDRLAFAAISSTYLVMAIPLEERSLLRAFGGAYTDYTRRVRWRVVPYLY
jgi:protein-S-isoprenylcysteine O-methyltransferase Ste14